ncbi:MAG: 16S rRNA (cytidine(1402)-2'-O)-methyltransferase [Pseudomonadota bacterium]
MSACIKPGCLYVVATPIGNVDDLSPRARAVLAGVDQVAAEDTRTSARLFERLGLRTPLTAMHDHNEAHRVPGLIARLQAGETLALVSDAGTPLISDPGYRLIAAAHDAGVTVVPVPGPCAAITALSAAGLASDRFHFEGFLPSRQGPRVARLKQLAEATPTLILYEAPHRIVETLEDLVATFGADRLATLARELTKTFETIRRASLGELLTWVMADSNQQRGEIVLVVAGAPEREAADTRALSAETILRVLVRELPVKQAAGLAAEIMGLKRNALYDMALALKLASESP